MIYIGGTVDLTKIQKTCKTCKTWTPGADICELNTIHQMECVTSLKRIHWTPNPSALMMKRIYCDTDGMTVTKPVNLIPRHAPKSLLQLMVNGIYGKDDDYSFSYSQRYYQYKLAMNYKGIIEAADNRESGYYPYMTENIIKCDMCIENSYWLLKFNKLFYDYCPYCGRKLN